jgi:transmembrane sensor
MQSEEARLKYLFQRYFNKTASREERNELTMLIGDEHNRALFMQLFSEAWQGFEGDGELISADTSANMLKQILAKEPVESEVPVRRIKWLRLVAAAAVLIILTGASWFFIKNKTEPASPAVVQETTHDVAPGSFKAQLTLSNGQKITLDSAAPGQLAKQGNTAVINKDGELLYRPEAGERAIVYNTITTSRGETYSFLLSDESKVWLNSASTIRFPVAFAGAERRIEITGEVYVKVAKDRAHPFIVSAGGMEVKAIGTEFNVNAYKDEGGISATLVEGSVQVMKREMGNGKEKPVMLKPGEQAISNCQLPVAHCPLTIDHSANIEEITGWKNGYFHFESADLQTILRQFARWYDIEVVYDGTVTKRKFFTIVKRSSTLKNVLELLQDNNIVYKIEGKKLIVSQ